MKKRNTFELIVISLLTCIIVCLITAAMGYFSWKYSDPDSAISVVLRPGEDNSAAAVQSMDDPKFLPLKATLSAYGFQMQQAYKNGDLQSWANIAQQAAAVEPNNPVTHFSLASFYLDQSGSENNIMGVMNILTRALAEIDTALELEPKSGNSHLLRALILSRMVNGYPYRADRDYLYKLAIADLNQASEYGTSLEIQPQRLKVRYQIQINDCNEALNSIPSLPRINNQNSAANSNTTDEALLADAYACLGQFTRSIESAQKDLKIANNQSSDYYMRLAISLYQAGKSNDAFGLVEKALSERSIGTHYFLKACIEYDQENYVGALSDGEKADQFSWSAGAYSSYFEGLEAERLGNTEEAIIKLQFAEAALDPQFDFAIKRSQAKLAALNAKPVDVTPVLHFALVKKQN